MRLNDVIIYYIVFVSVPASVVPDIPIFFIFVSAASTPYAIIGGTSLGVRFVFVLLRLGRCHVILSITIIHSMISFSPSYFIIRVLSSFETDRPFFKLL